MKKKPKANIYGEKNSLGSAPEKSEKVIKNM